MANRMEEGAPGQKRKKADLVGQYTKLVADQAQAAHGRRRGGDGKGSSRPYLASECKDVHDCERFRQQLLGQMAKKISQIQNAGLGEFKLRELNDEINKLAREKVHWERQIKALGGPDHALAGPKEDGGIRPRGSGGYAYYGAAKNLPGVRELFEVESQGPVKRTRTELYRAINPDYYGFRDEDDGLLVKLERRAEKKARSRAVLDLKKRQGEGFQFRHTDLDAAIDAEQRSMAVPSQAEVERKMLQLRKQQLLERYGISPQLAVDSESSAPAPAPAPRPQATTASA